MSVLLLCASLFLAACDDSDDGPKTVVKLNPAELSLTLDETQTLQVEITPPLQDAVVEWSSDNEDVATVDNGAVTGVGIGDAVVTARVGKSFATCKVKVSGIDVTEVTLDKTALAMKAGETQTLKAQVVPDNATDKTVVWTSSDEGVATVANGVVSAVVPGSATITAAVGEVKALCEVTVLDAPKIGDYFYSDGTWSDGGLVSIEADGLNPVWAAAKPAPVAGKTVIGIVCQTAPERIAQSDKDAGYVNGYVVAVKNAHGPDKNTTHWSADFEFSCLKGAKWASIWYGNVNGYAETQTVKETYVENIEMMPAFDWTLNDFSLEAPVSTSGWFLPSTGQLWDMMVNLCGGEVAALMKGWQTLDRDATYYCSEKVTYDVLGRFNATMSEIPAADKEELFITEDYYTTASVWASTPYDDEGACVLSIGTNGTVECMTNWYDADCIARPILAF